MFLQGSDFQVQHIEGKKNIFANWLSRMYDAGEMISEEAADMLEVIELKILNVNSAIGEVHYAKMERHGAQRTWTLLNKHYPGHKVLMRAV